MIGAGEIAALATALLWTLASVFWGKIALSALGMNVCKNWLGGLLILVQMAVLAVLYATPLFAAPLRSWCYLGMSGLVGIVVGDTLYFRSLQILGPRRALIMGSTSPLFAAALGWFVLRESLGMLALTGVFLTVAGVTTVVSDRNAKRESPGVRPGNAVAGVAMGLIAAVCQAGGGVFSKLGMTRIVDGQDVTDCGALEATFIRISVAAIITLAWLLMRREAPTVLRTLRHSSQLIWLILATVLGTWLGIWLSQIAYKESAVAIAQTLLSTCPLFAIPLIWFLHGHRSSWFSILGTVVAVVGIYLTVK